MLRLLRELLALDNNAQRTSLLISEKRDQPLELRIAIECNGPDRELVFYTASYEDVEALRDELTEWLERRKA